MHASSKKIGVFLCFMIITLAIGLMNHVIVIPPLLGAAKRDAWLSVLLAIVPLMLWVGMLTYIIKKIYPISIYRWLNERYGKVSAWFFNGFVILYLLSMAALTLKDTMVWSHVFYLPGTPIIFIALIFTAVCLFAAISGLRAIAISSGILLPFVVLFGDFVMSFNIPKKDYSLLLPILEHGWSPVLQGLIFVGGGFSELIIILLLQPYVRKKVRYLPLLILSLFLVLLIFGPLTGALAEFGPYEATRQRYPAYEEWRLVTIGKYIRHVDFLAIYQWLSGAFIRISIAIYLTADAFDFKKPKIRIAYLLIVGIALIVFVQLPISDARFVSFMSHFYFPVTLVMVLIVTIALFILALFTKRRRHPSCV